MTEQEYQDIRSAIKLKEVPEHEIEKLRAIRNIATPLRNQVFFWKNKVVIATRSLDRAIWPDKIKKNQVALENAQDKLKIAKQNFENYKP